MEERIVEMDPYCMKMVRRRLIRDMEMRGYNCEWTLLSDEDVFIQWCELFGSEYED